MEFTETPTASISEILDNCEIESQKKHNPSKRFHTDSLIQAQLGSCIVT